MTLLADATELLAELGDFNTISRLKNEKSYDMISRLVAELRTCNALISEQAGLIQSLRTAQAVTEVEPEPRDVVEELAKSFALTYYGGTPWENLTPDERLGLRARARRYLG